MSAIYNFEHMVASAGQAVCNLMSFNALSLSAGIFTDYFILVPSSYVTHQQ